MNEFGENLIFLISQPRAGSTLLQRILGGHSQIHATAEPWLMLHPLYALKREGFTADYNAEWARYALDDFLGNIENGDQVYMEAVRKMGLHLYDAVLKKAGKKFFLDKTPRYYAVLPELLQTFPKAKIIILLRNPLAVLASILENWVQGEWEKLSLFKHDLFLAPVRMAEMIEKHRDRASIVHYEALVTSPEQTVRKLCEALNVDFETAMIYYGKHAAPEGEMGDKGSIRNFTKPVTDRLYSWVDQLATPERRFLAERYLAFLQPNLAARLGYFVQELQTQLTTQNVTGTPLDDQAQDELLDDLGMSPFDLAYVQIREPKKRGGIGLSPEAENRIIERLQDLGVDVEDLSIDVNAFQQFVRKAVYVEKYVNLYHQPEKMLEHYVTAELLDLHEEDVYLDIENGFSPAPEIYERLFGVQASRKNIENSPDTSLPNEAAKIGFCGNFERFEGDRDVQFLHRLTEMLQKDGKACILPLYFAEEYAIQTDPKLAVAQQISFDEDAVVCCAEGWNNRFARFYDPESFLKRVVDNLKGFKVRLYRITKTQDISPECYLRFALLLTKSDCEEKHVRGRNRENQLHKLL